MSEKVTLSFDKEEYKRFITMLKSTVDSIEDLLFKTIKDKNGKYINDDRLWDIFSENQSNISYLKATITKYLVPKKRRVNEKT